MDLERKFQEEYKCPRCGNQGALTKELSMSGAGVKDVMHNRYLFVSCQSCGFTEVYNTKVLGQNGVGTDILDLFFG